MQAASGDTAIQYSAADLRALVDALVADEGVLTGLVVSQRAAGANMSVDVSAGFAVIFGDDVANQGKYGLPSTGVENLTVPAAPASGTRTHRVVARVKDKLHNGSWSTYEWTIELLADTGSGTPGTPASAISLATVSVSAGQSSVTNSNITSSGSSARLAGVTRPTVSDQASAPGFTVTATWVDFTGGQWPAVTVTVPPSGRVHVSIGCQLKNNNLTSSTVRASYRISGSNTVVADPGGLLDHHAVLNTGDQEISASRDRVFSGLTPGGSITVTPQWRISSGSSSTASLSQGQLIVTPLS